MKKIILLMLSLLVITAACGNKDSQDKGSKDKKTYTTTDGKK